MNIVLATGIYPPDIGGPATYAAGLKQELEAQGHRVTVLTYGRTLPAAKEKGVIRVENKGNMLRRYAEYRRALRKHAADADVVLAFSSVSTGIPLLCSGLTKPKKILRLGGDFFWERYTDAGGSLGLAAWYRSRFGIWRLLSSLFMEGILSSFDLIVYSTAFQKRIHEQTFRALPQVTVVENAVPAYARISHAAHTPLRLLFVGRLVRFKQLPLLLEAVASLPDTILTIVGSGPEQKHLHEQVRLLRLQDRVTFLPPVFGDAKQKLFAEHDLLVIPSVTEISPNVALEAVSAGLPVLLTDETGLSDTLSQGMVRAPMRTSMEIASAIVKTSTQYAALSKKQAAKRSWSDVASEWIPLFSQ